MRHAPEDIAREVARLSALGTFQPGLEGGWNYPFDFGHGVIAPVYAEINRTLMPWRRERFSEMLAGCLKGRAAADASMLELGAAEGHTAEAAWQLGVRDITCVEVNPLHLQKARFVADVKGYDYQFVEGEALHFLVENTRMFDVVDGDNVEARRRQHLFDLVLAEARAEAELLRPDAE